MQERNISEQQRSFLNKRGVTDKVIDAFSIVTEDVPHLGLRNAMIIPVNNPDGTLSFNKYRRDPMEGDVKPKYLYDRGGKVTLYGADVLVADLSDEPRPLVITEGELDTLVCWSANIPAVTSTGGALSFQKEWGDTLKVFGSEVYLCFDNDEAGYKGMLKVLDYLPEAKVVIIPHNLGCKDISDFVARGGDLHALLKGAYSMTGIEDARVVAERLGGQWRVEEAKFFRMYIEKNTVSNIPTQTGSKAALDPSKVGRMEAAKSVSCLSVVGKEWKKVGRYHKTTCLWHNDTDPSLTYYDEPKNNLYCHVCGKYADVIDLYMAVNNLSGKSGFKQAIDELLKG